MVRVSVGEKVIEPCRLLCLARAGLHVERLLSARWGLQTSSPCIGLILGRFTECQPYFASQDTKLVDSSSRSLALDRSLMCDNFESDSFAFPFDFTFLFSF